MNIELLANVALNGIKYDEENDLNNPKVDNINGKKIPSNKYTWIKNKLGKLINDIKLIKQVDINKIYNNTVDILMRIPPLKIKKYTVNEILAAILFISLRGEKYVISLNEIMGIVKKDSGNVFSRRSKYIISKIKNLINYVESIIDPRGCTIENITKLLCQKLKYPQKITDDAINLLHSMDGSELISHRKKTVSTSLVYISAKKNKLNVSLEYISEVSGVGISYVSKVFNIINNLLEVKIK